MNRLNVKSSATGLFSDARFRDVAYLIVLSGMVIAFGTINISPATQFLNMDEYSLFLQAYEFSPLDYFLNPDRYKVLSGANLTPWATFSFDVDIWLFGHDSRYFHLHNLFSLILLVIASYFLFRKAAGSDLAVLGVGLFISMAPVSDALLNLASRHYIEGLLFSAVSILLYLHSTKSKKPKTILGLSVFFYFLAMTAKEVYAPLILLFLFFGKRTWAEGISSSRGYIAVAALYLAWRWYMLGNPLGGYEKELVSQGIMSEIENSLRELLGVLLNIDYALFLSSASGWIIEGLMFFSLGYYLVRFREKLPLAGIAIIGLLAPLAAVGFVLQVFPVQYLLRYYFFLGWFLSLALVISVASIGSSFMRKGIMIILAVCTVVLFQGAKNFSEEKYSKGLARISLIDAVFSLNPGAVIKAGSGFQGGVVGGAAHFQEVVLLEQPPYIFRDPLVFRDISSFSGAYRIEGSSLIRDDRLKKNLRRQIDSVVINDTLRPRIELVDDGILWRRLEGKGRQYLIIHDSRRSLTFKMEDEEGIISGINRSMFLDNFDERSFIRVLKSGKDGSRVYSAAVEFAPPYK